MVNKKNTVVIGNKDNILVFKAIGCDVMDVSNSGQTRNALNKAINDYNLILITDDFACFVEDIIADTQNNAYPIVLVIPSGTNKSDYALKKISESVEKALGVNILLNKEKE